MNAEQAAQAIVDLINSRASSPRQDEIAAIIAKVAPTDPIASYAPTQELVDWCATVECYLDDCKAHPEDESIERLGEAFNAVTRSIWAKPVTSWADLVLRAVVSVHWNSPAERGDPAYPHNILREGPECDGPGYDEHALAHVVRGIVDLAGLALDPEGRLLSKIALTSSDAASPAVASDGRVYGPVLGSDGKPIQFNYTNVAFADTYCPWIRLAFAAIGYDEQELQDFVRKLVEEDPDEAKLLMDMLAAWKNIHEKFGAIAEFAEVAWSRTAHVATTMETVRACASVANRT